MYKKTYFGPLSVYTRGLSGDKWRFDFPDPVAVEEKSNGSLYVNDEAGNCKAVFAPGAWGLVCGLATK